MLSFPFPIKLSNAHVAYSAICQGRSPIRELMAACVTYGMAIQKQRDAFKVNDKLVIANSLRILMEKDCEQMGKGITLMENALKSVGLAFGKDRTDEDF